MSDAIIRSVITSYFFVGVVVGLITGLLLAALLSVSLRVLTWQTKVNRFTQETKPQK